VTPKLQDRGIMRVHPKRARGISAQEMLMADELEEDLAKLAEAFPDAEGPWRVYRDAYKYTACGPSVGMLAEIEYPDPGRDDPYRIGGETRWHWCDDLRRLGSTWSELQANGVRVLTLGVSSIVEGVDAETETIEVDLDGKSADELRAAFDAAVAEVDAQADAIWKRTHGCETCAKHLGVDLDAEYSPVWDECPDCGGHGTAM
jgi:hypothetical protein